MGVGRGRCGVKRRRNAEPQCEGCHYWRALGDGMKACHYCVDHHELRKRDGEKCLSRKAKNPEQSGAYKPRAMQIRM